MNDAFQRGYFATNPDGTEKSSVRLHHPAGGKSTFSLGWGSDVVEQKPSTKVYRNQSSVFGGEEPVSKPLADKRTPVTSTYGQTETYKPYGKTASRGQSSVVFGDEYTSLPMKKENLKPQTTYQQDPSPTKTSVRVRNPPGGKSTFSFA